MRRNYSGRFVIRIPPLLHRGLTREAVSRTISLNQLCLERLSREAGPLEQGGGLAKKFAPQLNEIQKIFDDDLLSLILFGSQVTGEATGSSDFDLLIVLRDSIPLGRALYRLWDERISDPSLSPQFVHLPSTAREAGGLWFEVALAHEILWEKNEQARRFLEGMEEQIALGALRRYLSHGQPYWVWRTDEK